MNEVQTYRTLENKSSLIFAVNEMAKNGYRLVQISADKKEDYDLLYSFAKANELVNLRLRVEADEQIESISGIYSYSYLYENELKDLFGLDILHINVDFKGNLYHTQVKTPFLNKA
ncbi:MAG: NADH-quinone oxidoreductase subunit C [Oscillospiraceae bacterium]|jgi:ech hydrogenase subunit D|nr:NADH-quinone oxidoreductase subunit C [Oscillospiraceae bacterium]